MDHAKLTRVLGIMRHGDAMEKTGGVVGTTGEVLKAIRSGAAAAGKQLTEKGHKNLGTVVKYLPHAAAAGALYKGYESPTGQKVRWKIREWKARRAARKAGYY